MNRFGYPFESIVSTVSCSSLHCKGAFPFFENNSHNGPVLKADVIVDID